MLTKVSKNRIDKKILEQNWNFDGILVPENGWQIKSDGQKKMFNVSKMVAAEIERSAIFQIGQRPKNQTKPKTKMASAYV